MRLFLSIRMITNYRCSCIKAKIVVQKKGRINGEKLRVSGFELRVKLYESLRSILILF